MICSLSAFELKQGKIVRPLQPDCVARRYLKANLSFHELILLAGIYEWTKVVSRQMYFTWLERLEPVRTELFLDRRLERVDFGHVPIAEVIRAQSLQLILESRPFERQCTQR